MNSINAIGLDSEKSNRLIEKLSLLLANYSVFYQNTRGYHWNIKGEKFFELHLKFEELYNNLFLKIDEIAERMLTLGGTPSHKYSDYIAQSSIKESKHTSDGIATVKEVVDSMKTILILQREVFMLSEDTKDEGTSKLISDYISEQEKMVWMYSSYIQEPA